MNLKASFDRTLYERAVSGSFSLKIYAKKVNPFIQLKISEIDDLLLEFSNLTPLPLKNLRQVT
jgi:hypothetical protein